MKVTAFIFRTFSKRFGFDLTLEEEKSKVLERDLDRMIKEALSAIEYAEEWAKREIEKSEKFYKCHLVHTFKNGSTKAHRIIFDLEELNKLIRRAKLELSEKHSFRDIEAVFDWAKENQSKDATTMELQDMMSIANHVSYASSLSSLAVELADCREDVFSNLHKRKMK